MDGGIGGKVVFNKWFPKVFKRMLTGGTLSFLIESEKSLHK